MIKINSKFCWNMCHHYRQLLSFWNREVASPELVSITAYRNVCHWCRGLALKKLLSSYFNSRSVQAGDNQQTLTQQIIPLNSICHVLRSETMKNVVIITALAVVKPRKGQPPYECLRLKGDLLCNKWYNQQQGHCLTDHTGLPSLPHFLSTVCNDIICINTGSGRETWWFLNLYNGANFYFF
jgi:hypothetical protein